MKSKKVKRKTKRPKQVPKTKGKRNTVAKRPDKYGWPSDERQLLAIAISGKGGQTTESAMLLNSVLSTITPGLRSMHYKSGISAGRSLYSIYNSERHYIWYEDGVADLVSFLERSGFTGITYNIFNDRLDIKFGNMIAPDIGTKIHSFESGLICGFLGAARQQHAKVEEEKCSANGSGFCQFTTSGTPLVRQSESREVLDKLASYIKEKMGGNLRNERKFSEYYYAMSSSILLESEYSEHMERIMHYLGRRISSMLFIADSKQLKRSIEQLYALLDLGSVRFVSAKPMALEIRFDRIKAKKEFVDISIAFLSGLLEGRLRNGISIRSSKKGNSQVVRVTESKV